MIDILLIAIIAIIIGANDASNVFGSAVGSKMLKFKISVILFGIFIFLSGETQGKQNTLVLAFFALCIGG